MPRNTYNPNAPLPNTFPSIYAFIPLTIILENLFDCSLISINVIFLIILF